MITSRSILRHRLPFAPLLSSSFVYEPTPNGKALTFRRSIEGNSLNKDMEGFPAMNEMEDNSSRKEMEGNSTSEGSKTRKDYAGKPRRRLIRKHFSMDVSNCRYLMSDEILTGINFRRR